MHKEGTDVRQLYQQDKKLAITSKNRKNGDIYLALFNISDEKQNREVKVNLSDLGLQKCKVTEMWNGKKMGTYSDEICVNLRPHESVLLKLKKVK